MNAKLIIILLALIYINCIESTIETNDENNIIGKAKASTNFHFPEVLAESEEEETSGFLSFLWNLGKKSPAYKEMVITFNSKKWFCPKKSKNDSDCDSFNSFK